MPNWTENYVTINGPPEILQIITDANLKFQILYPCPFIHDENYEEGWYDWCCSHWGTKWNPTGMVIDYTPGQSSLTANFETAWSDPDTFLLYLSHIYPGLKIENEWMNEGYETIGITVCENGHLEKKQIDPHDYTLEALEEFATDNPWFGYADFADHMEMLHEDMENEEEEEEEEEKEDVVVIKKTTYSHLEYMQTLDV